MNQRGNAKIDDYILSLANQLITRFTRRHLRTFSIDDREDAGQNVRLRLIEKILPAYDKSRGVIEGYLHVAIENAMLDERRRLRVERRGHGNVDSLANDIAAPDDGGADGVIHEVVNNPSSVLTNIKSQLLRRILSSTSRGELASELGISRDAADQRVKRLKADLVALI